MKDKSGCVTRRILLYIFQHSAGEWLWCMVSTVFSSDVDTKSKLQLSISKLTGSLFTTCTKHVIRKLDIPGCVKIISIDQLNEEAKTLSGKQYNKPLTKQYLIDPISYMLQKILRRVRQESRRFYVNILDIISTIDDEISSKRP